MLSFIYDRWFLKLLVVINALGTIWGFWWYHLQLAVTPLKWWPLVPDSPLSSAMFTLALILVLRGLKLRWFHLLACFVSIKYGVWAVVVISDFWLHGGQVRLMEVMLLMSHLGMAAEAVIYLSLAWPTKLSWLAFVIFTWANDIADYVFSKHPYFFYQGQEKFGLVSAILLSLTLSIAAIIVSYRHRDISEHNVIGKGLK